MRLLMTSKSSRRVCGYVILMSHLLLGCAAGNSVRSQSEISQDLTKKKYFIPGLVVGGFAGLGIVALIAKQEKWITVDLFTIAAGVVPGMVVGGAIGIALSGDDDK